MEWSCTLHRYTSINANLSVLLFYNEPNDPFPWPGRGGGGRGEGGSGGSYLKMSNIIYITILIKVYMN